MGFLPRHAARALDLGCGSGTLALELATRVPFVIGLDLSPTMLALARERQRELGCRNVAWVIARAEEPPFRPRSMDYIVSTNVVRLTDVAATVSAVKLLIRSRGRIAIRDHLMPRSRLAFWGMHLTRTIRLVLEWMHDYRGKGLWSILAYRVSLTGIRHARRNAALTRETFESIYTRALPGCRIDATVFSGLAVWDEMESRQPDQPRRS